MRLIGLLVIALVAGAMLSPGAVAGPHDDAVWRIAEQFDTYSLGELNIVSNALWGTDGRVGQMIVVNDTYYSSPNCVRMTTVTKDGWFGYDPEVGGYTPSSGIIYFHFRVRSPVHSGTLQVFKANITSTANPQEYGGNPFGEWIGDETRLRPMVGGQLGPYQYGPYQSLTDGAWHEVDMKHVVSTKVTTWSWDGVQVWQLDLDGAGITELPNGTVQKMQFEAMRDNPGYTLCIDDVRLGSNVAAPGPGPVTNFRGAGGNGKVTLTWHNPSEASYSGVMIRYSTDAWPLDINEGTLLVNKSGSPGVDDSYSHTGLTNGLVYYYAAFAHDASSRYSVRAGANATPSPTGIGPVTVFAVSRGSGQNNLSWRNSSSGDFAGTTIRYKTTGYPTGPTDGTLLVNKSGVPNANETYTHSGTSDSTVYYYAAFAHDSVPNYAQPAFASSVDPIVGYLRLHPNNPHYFQEANTGKPVMFIGAGGAVPSSNAMDYHDHIDQQGAWRCNYGRVWHILPWEYYDGQNPLFPWARSSTPGACMGGNKYDLNTWDTEYWFRMSDAMSLAVGIESYMEIHLFDRCGMSPAAGSRWHSNPWASNNNINNLEVPDCDGDGTPDFYQYSTKPNLRNQQERYVRKMIDSTVAYGSVLYEVENEHWNYPSVGWADHYAQFVKDYIAANYPTLPKLVSYSSIESDADLDTCYSMPAPDIVNRHYGNEAETDPSVLNTYMESHWGYNKAINIDEFANGVTDPNLLRVMCWTIISSGGSYHVEDASPTAKAFDICENISHFVRLSAWDFIHAAPNKALITSGGGYCMAQPGVEYVCYFPTGGNKTISLLAGDYRVEWWNPRSGGFYNVAGLSHSGGGKILAAPDAGDWVLHITTQAAPVSALQSKPAGAITIDGASGDWNLAELTAKICAGDTGTGTVGILGFDSNGICYSGGHHNGTQYPPTSAADHAVRFYSRHDSSNLYLLVRCDDSDIRAPNPTSANWSNDCIEFYFDPGHDGGATANGYSASDLQLVIDAINQKNVYMTTGAYKTQILAGVTSAVTTDASGWWLEVRIAKNALTPALPALGTIGVDFNVRDNDQNLDAQSTIYTWRDPETSTGFPTKIPNRWGDLELTGAPDTTPPGSVTGLGAVAGPGQITLSWTNPSDSDFTGTMIRFKTTGYPTGPTDGTLVVDEPGAPGAPDGCTHTGLAAGVTYYYSAFAHDAAPNYAVKADTSGIPLADITPPANVTGFSGTAGDNQVSLSWTNPSTSDFTGTVIRFKTTGYPTGPTDGTLVVDKAGAPGSAGSHTHTGLTNGTVYYYRAYAHDVIPNYASGVSTSSTPADTQAPGQVTTFTATPGNQQVLLNWTNPSTSDFAGTMIRFKTTGYPTSRTDGTMVCNRAASPGSVDSFMHTGLTNDIAYYYAAFTYDEIPNYSASSTASTTPATVTYCFREDFAYTDGNLNGRGNWSGTATNQIRVVSQTARIDGNASYLYETKSAGPCPGGATGIIYVHAKVKSGVGATTLWGLWFNDAAGNNLARWYGSGTTATGRIGGYSIVTASQTLTGGWDSIDARIYTASNQTEFFFNGTSLGTYSHVVTGAGDSVGQVQLEVIGNSGAIGHYVLLDEVTVTDVDVTAPGPVTGFTAIAGNGFNNLMWTNPSDMDFAGVKILAKTTGYPSSPTDGTVVYTGNATSCKHIGITNGVTQYYRAYAYDEVPNYSTAAQASVAPIYFGPVQAKLCANGAALTLTVGTVSAIGTDWFYAQCPRPEPVEGAGCGLCGIKVVKAAHGVLVGQSVGAKGTAETDAIAGEKYISATWASGSGTGSVPAVGMANLTLGGGGWNYNPSTGAGQIGIEGADGTNNIGLLVRVWGRVTQRDMAGLQYFYVNDGSGLLDGTQTVDVGNVGIRIKADPTSYAPNAYVIVTGVSSCFKDGSLKVRPLVVPVGITPL